MIFQDFDTKCIELLKARPNRQSRHCFRSAINHLERAEKLFPIDNPMAVFRCFTAEEEAASGLMYCLKDKGYLNAEKLNPRNHVHKNAIIQFLSVLIQFSEDQFRRFSIEMFLNMAEGNGNLFLEVHMDLGQGVTRFIPDPPLNFKLLHEDKRFSYREQIEKLVASKEARDIGSYLKGIANQRNLVLYASQKGFPNEIKIEDKFFPAYQKRVLAMLRIYLMIDPYEDKQSFVQDALDAFLTMLIKYEFEDIHDEF